MNPGAVVISRTGAAVAADFSNATGAPIVGDTLTGQLYWYASGNPFPIADFINVKSLGAIGDDVTDDIAAFVAADAVLAALGGGTLRIPAGTYKLSSRYQPSNNVHVLGDGIGVTNLHDSASTSPSNIPIDIRGTLGANYGINAPTEGALTVTTTVAGDAANFSAGDNIAVSGVLFSNDYGPFWITKVVSAVAGVITLTEPLPRADYSLVHKLTTLKQNIIIEGLSMSQAGDLGTVSKYSRDIIYRNVQFGTALTTAGINVVSSRNVTVEHSRAFFNLGSNSSYETVFERNIISGAGSDSIIFENSCEGGKAIFNTVLNPTNSGIKIDTSSQRVKALFNEITNVHNLFGAITIDGNALGFGENIIIGNRLFGNTVGDYGVVIGGTSHDNIIMGNSINGFDYGVFLGAGNNLRNVVGPNSYKNMVIANTNITVGSTLTDLQIGNALVALGGGAAPTLGTIGGTGPATAGQNSWMKVLDSTGTAFWVPVWK